MQPAQIVVVIVIGLIAGWLASLVVGGGSLVKYIVWGLLGSFVGGFLLPRLGLNISLGNALVDQIVVAAIGAVIVVLIARIIG